MTSQWVPSAPRQFKPLSPAAQACTPYNPDGTKGIAKTLKTNYVIAPPPPPPPRRMLIVRNNVVVSVGKPGQFRTTAG